MVALTLSPQVRYNGALGVGIERRAKALVREVRVAQREAAATAQSVSIEEIQRRRPDAPPRPGRDQASISSTLRWTPFKSGDVGINLATLNESAKHWIIQEIGTGQRAVVRIAGRTNPVGRPVSGATYIRTVPAQRGRRIKASLVWATGPSGRWVPAGAGENQQLYLRKMIKLPRGARGAAYSSAFPGRSQPGIVIRREIEPRHFVQRGGIAGFSQYRSSVLGAARRTFRKGRLS